ncbi:protein translocase subunit SecF [Syntrophus aciditrophicus]|uniref:Protein-export membrane protein SecF n=1 Tax=Syntrophus aciditrophicus (strain SB) TaxID=56780 RepID=Q2LVH3_SYNAS|nr:protein translocase subunit SecF [Syntrophus aciditrophicus]ABC78084.1 protein translocase subunit [Syntrophus aciditrophicus SB]
MEIIKSETHFNFVAMMKMAVTISIVYILIGIASIFWHGGLNFGIDFAGGTLIQIRFDQETSVEKLRQTLEPIGMENSIIQQFGPNEMVVRTAASSMDLKGLSGQIENALQTTYGQKAFEIRRVESVGPKVGSDLTRKALLAIIFSWIGILVYVGFRFELRYAFGGIIALVHDVLVTVGTLSLLNKEFDLIIVAALLTIIGYSINDTIVIFDRIRENTRKNMKMPLMDVINLSVNQTLSRTLLTSFTVILVLLALFFFGGPVIHDFAFTLLVGCIAGVYSTVFIASPIVLAFEKIRPSRIKRN